MVGHTVRHGIEAIVGSTLAQIKAVETQPVRKPEA